MKDSFLIYGAVIGDVVGSAYEFSRSEKDKAPSRVAKLNLQDRNYTDDTVRTRAVLYSLEEKEDTAVSRRFFGKHFPPKKGGFGSRFSSWLSDSSKGPYHSFGNGAGRRISPVAYFASSLKECDDKAKEITSLTHDHMEGIKAGCIIADLTYLALKGYSKEERKKLVLAYYPECLSFGLEDLHQHYVHTEKARDSVPQALFCFFATDSFLSCLQAVCYIGGDADTIGARSMAIASAYYRSIPDLWINFVSSLLPTEFNALLQKAPCPIVAKHSHPLKEEEIKTLTSYQRRKKAQSDC